MGAWASIAALRGGSGGGVGGSYVGGASGGREIRWSAGRWKRDACLYQLL